MPEIPHYIPRQTEAKHSTYIMLQSDIGIPQMNICERGSWIL